MKPVPWIGRRRDLPGLAGKAIEIRSGHLGVQIQPDVRLAVARILADSGARGGFLKKPPDDPPYA